MRIVANPEFLTLPEGTLFCRFDGFNLDAIEIKGQTSDMMNDFLFQGLLETALVGDAWMDFVHKGENVGKKFDLYEGDCWGRDAEYDEEAMYAVFDREDVMKIIDKLTRSVLTAYKAS
jgi:hypothetical protein